MNFIKGYLLVFFVSFASLFSFNVMAATAANCELHRNVMYCSGGSGDMFKEGSPNKVQPKPVSQTPCDVAKTQSSNQYGGDDAQTPGTVSVVPVNPGTAPSSQYLGADGRTPGTAPVLQTQPTQVIPPKISTDGGDGPGWNGYIPGRVEDINPAAFCQVPRSAVCCKNCSEQKFCKIWDNMCPSVSGSRIGGDAVNDFGNYNPDNMGPNELMRNYKKWY